MYIKSPMAFLWSGLYFILLVSFLTPFSVITISLLMLPPLVLYGTLGRVRFIPYVVAPLVLLFILFQSFALPLFLLVIFFLIPSVVMGELYRRDSSAGKVVLVGTLTIIGELLFALLLSYALNFDVALEMRKMMLDSYNTMPALLQTEIPQDVIDLSISMVTQMIPLFMVGIGVYYVAITHMLGRRVLRNFGVPAQSLPPIREWMLPKSLVIYYVIALLLDLLLVKSLNSVMTTILLNAIPLLMAAFTVQAISFLLFVSQKKQGWKFLLPAIGIIAIPFVPSLVSLLGVLDVAFPLRKRLKG